MAKGKRNFYLIKDDLTGHYWPWEEAAATNLLKHFSRYRWGDNSYFGQIRFVNQEFHKKLNRQRIFEHWIPGIVDRPQTYKLYYTVYTFAPEYWVMLDIDAHHDEPDAEDVLKYVQKLLPGHTEKSGRGWHYYLNIIKHNHDIQETKRVLQELCDRINLQGFQSKIEFKGLDTLAVVPFSKGNREQDYNNFLEMQVPLGGIERVAKSIRIAKPKSKPHREIDGGTRLSHGIGSTSLLVQYVNDLRDPDAFTRTKAAVILYNNETKGQGNLDGCIEWYEAHAACTGSRDSNRIRRIQQCFERYLPKYDSNKIRKCDLNIELGKILREAVRIEDIDYKYAWKVYQIIPYYLACVYGAQKTGTEMPFNWILSVMMTRRPELKIRKDDITATYKFLHDSGLICLLGVHDTETHKARTMCVDPVALESALHIQHNREIDEGTRLSHDAEYCTDDELADVICKYAPHLLDVLEDDVGWPLEPPETPERWSEEWLSSGDLLLVA